jgi:histidinol phosphatase-like enzyme
MGYPAVFLDRDGVINEEVTLLHRIEDFKLILIWYSKD